jgi:hypothetical protein
LDNLAVPLGLRGSLVLSLTTVPHNYLLSMAKCMAIKMDVVDITSSATHAAIFALLVAQAPTKPVYIYAGAPTTFPRYMRPADSA